MRAIVLYLVIALVGPVARAAAAQVQPSGICASEGNVSFLCGPQQPEDLYHIPGTDWVVTSSFGGAGGVHIINTREKSSAALYPAPAAADKLDSKTYVGCKHSPSAEEKAKFTTLGITVGRGKNGLYPLYAIRFPESTVEVFTLDLRRPTPSATWIGCVEAPEKALLNSLVPLPGGGFIASKFYERGEGMAASRAMALAGGVTGELWEWRPRKGWSKVPGSEGAGLNGIELSKDGKWVYVCEWGKQSIYRLSLGQQQPKREAIQLDFRPDNMHWDSHGALLVAGNVEGRSNVIRLDPDTMKATQLIVRPDTEVFGRASVAVEVGNEIWLGSPRAGERIAIYPDPGGR